MAIILEKFWDADALEDHNTFDMTATTFGAPNMQELNNPSLHFRRFRFGEAAGVAGKHYLPDTINTFRYRFCSRVRASDDPVIPVTSGSMWLWFGFRSNPKFQWRFYKLVQAHPNQTLPSDWTDWTIDLPYSVLGPLDVFPSKFLQFSIVRRGDDPTDTATDTNWDLLALNFEVL